MVQRSTSLEYKSPPRVASIQQDWLISCQSSALISGLLALTSTVVLVFFKIQDNLPTAQESSAGLVALYIGFFSIFLSMSACISCLILLDSLGKIPYRATQDSNLRLMWVIFIQQRWAVWHWLACSATMPTTVACEGFCHRFNPQPSSRYRQQSAVTAPHEKLWENGETLKIFFINGSLNQPRKIEDTFPKFQDCCNLSFVVVNQCEEAHIRIKFDHSGPTRSYVGKDATAVDHSLPTMEFTSIFNHPRCTSKERYYILHEFSHALGLLHEHQSPLRNYQFLSGAEKYFDGVDFDDEVSRRYGLGDIGACSSPDHRSVMNYRIPPGSNDGRYDIPSNEQLSELDKAYLFISYPIPKNGQCMRKMLQVAGIDKPDSDTILTHYRNGEWEKVRESFCESSIAGAGLGAEVGEAWQ